MSDVQTVEWTCGMVSTISVPTTRLELAAHFRRPVKHGGEAYAANILARVDARKRTGTILGLGTSAHAEPRDRMNAMDASDAWERRRKIKE